MPKLPSDHEIHVQSSLVAAVHNRKPNRVADMIVESAAKTLADLRAGVVVDLDMRQGLQIAIAVIDWATRDPLVCRAMVDVAQVRRLQPEGGG